MPEIKTRWTTKKKEASKTQQPRRRFWPNPGDESFRQWKSNWTCDFLSLLQWKKEATMQKPSNPDADYQTQAVSRRLPNSGDGNQIGHTVSRRRSSGGEEHVGEWVWFFILDLICSWVFGAWMWRVGRHLERKERKNKKKNPCVWLNWNRVQRTQFPLNKTKSFGLDFHEGKASPLGSISRPTWTVCPAQLLCNGKLSAIYSIYTKIESFGLNLLNTKIVSNLG